MNSPEQPTVQGPVLLDLTPSGKRPGRLVAEFAAPAPGCIRPRHTVRPDHLNSDLAEVRAFITSSTHLYRLGAQRPNKPVGAPPWPSE
ncbi:hypothetical protein ACN20G_28300 (plasmid) [Streptomyces sp. BI20]|uniref:hypothetical protein n=1 Tax=Streptomyces sp. BI20 TaxID=3403460 RepID=UPI003C741E71